MIDLVPIGEYPLAHAAFLLLVVGSSAFFSYLAILNVRHGRATLEREREWVQSMFDVDDPDQVSAYHRAKTTIGQVQSWFTLAVVLLALYTGVAGGVVTWLQGLDYGPVLTGSAFFVAVLIGTQALSLPGDLYDTFVVEERFGFNNQTPSLFVRDLLIQLLISAVLVGALSAAILATVETLPTLWPVAALAIFAGFSLAMLVVYPRVIAPLFNDFEPVESGELRDGVERVFDRAGFTCDDVYVMDASRRSGHSNAYFVGFGRTKRVVLYDTLVEQMELRQLESVLAHELAHWKRAHIWKQFVASLARIGVALAVLWVLLDATWLYAMFDLPQTPYVGLALGALWVSPLLDLTSPLVNRLSLAHEREADAFATDVMGDGEPLVGALASLTGENLSNPFPHPLYATFHYDHPPIPERIRYIRGLTSEEVDETASIVDGS
ncbi:zn-dependent protease with chaperone function [Halovivax asiaticus JCM 14624]|uniref:Zn-dependent protease with chaperone function n=1 Tax=Halovivax asiaticus JCM 14624 TaxID=1227490 RepID=M0BU38_9EURY|nr:M48 family metallopeptidase [Halovivax asiaticus]ELZ13913.1 zn-dependent protease with chaperone function [Halovivax asiaticus JCM 14624]